MDRTKRAKKSHISGEYFESKIYESEFLSYLNLFLKSDLGDAGDITTNFLFTDNKDAHGEVTAKEDLVLAGKHEVFAYLHKNYGVWDVKPINSKNDFNDGDLIKKGETIFSLNGPIKNLLRIERTILNFLQRMSGIATLCREAVIKSNGDVLICPTRKTFWGALDKKACLAGGAGTHRINLSDAILIKNNHLDNFVSDELEKENESIPKEASFLEIEVKNKREAITYATKLKDLKLSIEKILMLDNMCPEQIESIIEGLKMNKLYELILIEASGGINLGNLKRYLKTGVDIISMGELTHSARAVDISMKIDRL